MASSTIPDIVLDTKLEVQVHPEHTIYFRYVGNDMLGLRPVKRAEEWKRERVIGRGGFGSVWLECCVTGEHDRRGQMRAVKKIDQRQCDRVSQHSVRELEAIGKFSLETVGLPPLLTYCFLSIDRGN